MKTLSRAALFGRYGEDEFDSLGAYTPLPDAAHNELRQVRLEYEPGRCAHTKMPTTHHTQSEPPRNQNCHAIRTTSSSQMSPPCGDECDLHPCKTPHTRLLHHTLYARRRRGFLRWYLDGALAFEVSSSSLGAYAEEPRPSVEVDPDFVYPNSTAWLAPRVTAAARLESA